MNYKRIEIKNGSSTEPVQFVGVYALNWLSEWGPPECGFVEIEEPEMKWYKFKARTPGNKQKLPPEKRPVLVRLENLKEGALNPIVVGYLKFHAGVKSEPYFVTPGATIESKNDDSRSLEWCDCLPNDFKWDN